jgi:hypothetical protein
MVDLPPYGNFGGNGDNDAWEQSDRYYTYLAHGLDPMNYAGGPPGYGSLFDPREYGLEMRSMLARHPDNVGIVLQILDEIDRDPINDADNAYLNHDLYFASDNIVQTVANNVAMGVGVWDAIWTDRSLDPHGYAYGAGSAPFIGYLGSAYNVVNWLGNKARENPNVYEVEEVVIRLDQPLQDTYWLEVTSVTPEHFSWDFGTSYLATAWEGFKDVVGDAFSGIISAFGAAGGWFREHVLNNQANRSAPPPDPYVNIDLGAVSFTTFEVGDQIDTSALSRLDDGRDGVIDASDKAFAFLATGSDQDNDGVLTAEELVPLNELTVIDLEGEQQEIFYARSVLSVVNSTQPPSTITAADIEDDAVQPAPAKDWRLEAELV